MLTRPVCLLKHDRDSAGRGPRPHVAPKGEFTPQPRAGHRMQTPDPLRLGAFLGLLQRHFLRALDWAQRWTDRCEVLDSQPPCIPARGHESAGLGCLARVSWRKLPPAAGALPQEALSGSVSGGHWAAHHPAARHPAGLLTVGPAEKGGLVTLCGSQVVVTPLP